VTVLDEARADLRSDQALAVEDANCVAAEADEQRGDDVVAGQRLEERRQPHRAVLVLMWEPERRSYNNGLAGELDPHHSVGIARPALRTLERGQPLADVLPADEAGH